jgi:dipeptidyl aminopeptidase/acylaminoacyl peptidase
MIVFQGLLDKVVPPSVAQEVIDVLKSLNLPYQYVEYADEGHGFRQTENNIDAWRKELSFYQQHLVTQ